MRPVKHYRSGGSYLASIMQSAVMPFAYRQGVNRLLGISPDSALRMRAGHGYLPINMHYLQGTGAYENFSSAAMRSTQLSPMQRFDTKPEQVVSQLRPVTKQIDKTNDKEIESAGAPAPSNRSFYDRHEYKRRKNPAQSVIDRYKCDITIESDKEVFDSKNNAPTIQKTASPTDVEADDITIPKSSSYQQSKNNPSINDSYAFIKQLGKQLEAENFGDNPSDEFPVDSGLVEKAGADNKLPESPVAPEITRLDIPDASPLQQNHVHAPKLKGISVKPEALTKEADVLEDFESSESSSGRVQPEAISNNTVQFADFETQSAVDSPPVKPQAEFQASTRHAERQMQRLQNIQRAQKSTVSPISKEPEQQNKSSRAVKKIVKTVNRVQRRGAASAFWERSYLGRTRLRIYR